MRTPIRFGVVAPVLTDVPTWVSDVRRIADLGYSTILMPDVPQWQPAPGPALATAAAVTDLRVGTWVYASPFRPAWMTAWEAHSLTTLTQGRFELGIGTGRPDIEDELRDKGLSVGSPSERLAQLREAVETLRRLDGPGVHTPVAMAVRGPKARGLAADVADVVTFALVPDDSRAVVLDLATEFRTRGGIELAQHIPVVGDQVSPFMAPPDVDTAALHAVDSPLVLPDDPSAAVDELLRRRDEIGFSYFVVGANVAERLGPVVARVAGR